VSLPASASSTTTATPPASALEALRGAIPEAAKDIRLNLQAVMEGGALSVTQRWLVALAAAYASRSPRLSAAIAADARAATGAGEAGEAAGEAVIDDARAAAALMALNNVYYRFRHLVGKPGYSERPARLRMNRLARPAGSRVDLELACLAVSAINGCESCVRAHERTVLEGGLGEEHVHDAVRIAATIHAAAVALELELEVEVEVEEVEVDRQS
jgi:lipoyl-dependent peroxiredoxin subunit D